MGLWNTLKGTTVLGGFETFGGPVGAAGIAAAPFTGGASLALTGSAMANSANDASVDKQNAFQMNASNTSYQRATADMAAAGLNPMLAYQQGGASTPSGASNTNHIDATQGFNSARSTSSNVSLQSAQTANTISATQLNTANVAKSKADTIASLAAAKNANASANRTAVDTQLNLAKLPAEQNSAKAANTWFGRNISPYLKDVGRSLNVVKSLPGVP